jgi:hypothetical protein
VWKEVWSLGVGEHFMTWLKTVRVKCDTERGEPPSPTARWCKRGDIEKAVKSSPSLNNYSPVVSGAPWASFVRAPVTCSCTTRKY